MRDLLAYFIPINSITSDDSIQNYKINLLVAIAVISTFFDFSFFPLFLMLDYTWGMIIFGTAIAATYLGLFLYKSQTFSQKQFTAFFNFLILVRFIGASVTSGGLLSPFALLFIFSPFIAFLIAGKKSGITWGVMTITSVLVLLILNSSGVELPSLYDVTNKAMMQGFLLVALPAIGTILAGIFVVLQNKAQEELLKSKAEVESKVSEALAEVKAEQDKQEIKQQEEFKRQEKENEYVNNYINNLLDGMNKFAEGDLTIRVSYLEDKSLTNSIILETEKKIVDGFNNTVARVNKLVTQLKEVVQSAVTAGGEISSSTEQMSAGAQEQSAQAQEVASSIEEMTKTIMNTAENSSQANESAKNANSKTKLGSQKVAENKEGVKRIFEAASNTGKIIGSLAGKTDQIGKITQVIDEIADQTNLLALNAAIEAARAGEQGRGFAVVADEVRKLAERTTKATKEIADTIKEIQGEANDADASMIEAKEAVMNGQKLTDELEVVLSEILASVEDVSLQIAQVASAGEEQSSAAEQISKNIESINIVSQQTATGTEQVARSAEDLNRLTENLYSMISKFKIDTKQQHNKREEKSNVSIRSNGRLITDTHSRNNGHK